MAAEYETPVLEIQNLSLCFKIAGRRAYAIQNVSLSISRGKTVALVGESGCGKTMTALTCMGLEPPSSAVACGTILLNGKNILSCTEKEWQEIRGKKISMIFQEPMSALNPLVKVGQQVMESGIVHGMDKKMAEHRALDLLDKTGLPSPKRLADCYPHQLSGGQRQRIMIASALMNSPDVLIADEPTTSLDVTIQTQIIDLLKDLNRTMHMAVLFITHDLGIVKRICDDIYIMYAGRIVESGDTGLVNSHPEHLYTRALIDSIPAADKRGHPLKAIEGTVPMLGNRADDGCEFYPRCPCRRDICTLSFPEQYGFKDHAVWCHLYDDQNRHSGEHD